MVERILHFLNREIRGIHEAAYLLGLFAILSQLLALVRDRLLAHSFGAGLTLDVYYASFRIPDLIFVGIASFVSAYILIPLFTERLALSSERGRTFLDSVFTLFSLAIITVSTAIFFFVPDLLENFFPVLFYSPLQDEFVLLSRILLLQPILLGASSLFSTVTQVYRKFILFAVSPVLYNIGIVCGILVFYPLWGLRGLGVGVVLGALLHLAIQLPFIFSERLTPRFRLPVFREVKDVLLLALPRTIALSAGQISLFTLVVFAGLLLPGAVSVFNLAFNLQAVPLAIIGVSYSVAAFPVLARLYSSGAREEFLREIMTAARHIIFWSIPAATLFIVLRAQIVRVILGSGAFSWSNTRLTAAALGLFALSLVGQAIVLLFARGYYAAGNTLKPLFINVFSSSLAVSLAYGFLVLFERMESFRLFVESLLRVEGIPGTNMLMLPLGYSLAMLLNALLLLLFFRSDFAQSFSALVRVFFRTVTASFVVGAVAYEALRFFDDFFDISTFAGIFAQGFGAGFLGILAGVIALKLLRSPELDEALSSLRGKFWKTKTVLPD